MGMARSGDVQQAIEVLTREIAHERSGRARFQRKIQLAQICMSTGHEAIAYPILVELAQAPRKEPVLNTDIYAIDMSEIGARIAQIVADNAPVEAVRPAPKVGHAGPKVSPTAPRLTSNGGG